VTEGKVVGVNLREPPSPAGKGMHGFPLLADHFPDFIITICDPFSIDEEVKVLGKSLVMERALHVTSPITSKPIA
jgi:hypothetical protein